MALSAMQGDRVATAEAKLHAPVQTTAAHCTAGHSAGPPRDGGGKTLFACSDHCQLTAPPATQRGLPRDSEGKTLCTCTGRRQTTTPPAMEGDRVGAAEAKPYAPVQTTASPPHRRPRSAAASRQRSQDPMHLYRPPRGPHRRRRRAAASRQRKQNSMPSGKVPPDDPVAVTCAHRMRGGPCRPPAGRSAQASVRPPVRDAPSAAG